MDNVYLNKDKYQRLLCDFITSGEYNKVLEFTHNGDNRDVRNGFMLGLCWASMLTSKPEVMEMEGDIIQGVLDRLEEGLKERFKRTLEILETDTSEDTDSNDEDIAEPFTNIFVKGSGILEDILNNPHKYVHKGKDFKVTL